MKNLNIQYSVDFEVKGVIDTLEKLEWFKEKGYLINLPAILLEESNFNRLSKENIISIVKSEYNNEKYEETKKYILKEWKSDIFDIKELKKINFNPLSEYEVILTRYGVGGGYYLPDKIVVNIEQRYGVGLMKTIVHETIHLLVESEILKNKISHWKKERIVDLLSVKLSPDFGRLQNLPEDTSLVDDIFNNKYPDIELIIREIGFQN
jgi:hypothetical protein